MPQINESVLRDPRYPVSAIADALLPYLRVLVDQFSPDEVILFGSYAYGDPRADSDVDLLVVFETNARWDLWDLFHLENEVEALLGREVDLVEKAALRNPFRRHEILTTRQVLYAA